MAQKEDPAVTTFREYIRINTMHPNPDYGPCTEFLKKQGKVLGAEVKVLELGPGNPTVVMTLPGTDPSLPSIMLNSHTDVVPVFPEHWKYDPFSAHKEENGDIYGRGTQDMKCVGMQYIEALRKLQKGGKGTFLRTIHLTFVPDEEDTGTYGMNMFVESETFLKMNVGFALDEGYANTGEEFFVFYGERSPWNLWVKCKGQPGHGSQFLEDTAGEKLRRVSDSFLAFRDQEEDRLKKDSKLALGDVTTVNLTMLKGGVEFNVVPKDIDDRPLVVSLCSYVVICGVQFNVGGVQFNVVPAELSVGFNIRVPPTMDMDALEAKMQGWCREAGKDVIMDFQNQTKCPQTTCVEDGKSAWWDAFAGACKKEDIKLIKEIFPAATDSRYLREIGIPALGFSPMNHTPLLSRPQRVSQRENIPARH
ncbi:Aminoacylase-1 [Chionoecetes opilio]|uniref:N-acyl-aliphatic-L-amino acid amidohydrolase n=1 Tax=Chionoecetes opilio TaxID=41210 RepID=A0A8J4YDA4_CHIOP|nr:Aminoacylase-1 [Chionoecetes opilio]